jgi:hypothetical protein
MEIKEGQVIKMKKKHPCGSDEWLVLRTGIEIKLRCMGCERELLLPRRDVVKNIKNG